MITYYRLWDKLNRSGKKQKDLKEVQDETELKALIRKSIKNYLFKTTKKNPMILPVVTVV